MEEVNIERFLGGPRRVGLRTGTHLGGGGVRGLGGVEFLLMLR